MNDSSQKIQRISELANVLLEKLSDADQEISLDFNDMTLQGPGPQGQQGQWRLNGQLKIKTKKTDKMGEQ